MYLYQSNPVIKAAIDRMSAGINGSKFFDVVDSLRYHDPYMVLADFDSYREAQSYASKTYSDLLKWQSMSLMNIANAGVFSADRAVEDYARDIWHL